MQGAADTQKKRARPLAAPSLLLYWRSDGDDTLFGLRFVRLAAKADNSGMASVCPCVEAALRT
jgi:hypothetical protein